MMLKIFSVLCIIQLFFILVSCQESTFEGEQCNDVFLYEIIKTASKTTMDPAEIRQSAMKSMQQVYPLARSMGCICTDRKFQFPESENHRYCSVRVSNFKCHAIVF